MSDHLGCAASQPGRALLFEGLLPSALAVQSYSITLVPSVEAQLWQQQRQQLLSEAVITIQKQSTHSMTGCQPHLQMEQAQHDSPKHLETCILCDGLMGAVMYAVSVCCDRAQGWRLSCDVALVLPAILH